MQNKIRTILAPNLAIGLMAFVVNNATATEPCDDFGECKVLIEINATDGDIGFHFLMDGHDLTSAWIFNPDWKQVFQDSARGPLRQQKLTETFAESAEPLCWEDPEADDDERIVNLGDFLGRWDAGFYYFLGRGNRHEWSYGETELTYHLPAAPADVDFDGKLIMWDSGDDLGNCATRQELDDFVANGILPLHPGEVDIDTWEVVLVPEVEEGDPVGMLKYSIRVPGDIFPREVSVPAQFLDSLPADTLVKLEVGAIGGNDNATFTEADGFCVNEVEGCEEQD